MKAQDIQFKINRIIAAMCSCHGNLYAVMKEILRKQGIDIGGVRKPLPDIIDSDKPIIENCYKMIEEAKSGLK